MEKIEKVLLLAVLGVALMIIAVMSFVPGEELLPGEPAGEGQAGTGQVSTKGESGQGGGAADGQVKPEVDAPRKSLAELLGADAPPGKGTDPGPEDPAAAETETEVVAKRQSESETPVFHNGTESKQAGGASAPKESEADGASIAMLEFAQNPNYLVYRVRRGDTLSQIAERVCGTQLVVEDLLKVNEGVDRDSIRPGQALLIPKWVREEGLERATVPRAPRGRDSEEPGAKPGGATAYTVRKGDSLWKIASRQVKAQHEVPAYVKRLQDLNPAIAGGVLRPGMKLRLR